MAKVVVDVGAGRLWDPQDGAYVGGKQFTYADREGFYQGPSIFFSRHSVVG
jgi:hypothetical protein